MYTGSGSATAISHDQNDLDRMMVELQHNRDIYRRRLFSWLSAPRAHRLLRRRPPLQQVWIRMSDPATESRIGECLTRSRSFSQDPPLEAPAGEILTRVPARSTTTRTERDGLKSGFEAFGIRERREWKREKKKKKFEE